MFERSAGGKACIRTGPFSARLTFPDLIDPPTERGNSGARNAACLAGGPLPLLLMEEKPSPRADSARCDAEGFGYEMAAFTGNSEGNFILLIICV